MDKLQVTHKMVIFLKKYSCWDGAYQLQGKLHVKTEEDGEGGKKGREKEKNISEKEDKASNGF